MPTFNVPMTATSFQIDASSIAQLPEVGSTILITANDVKAVVTSIDISTQTIFLALEDGTEIGVDFQSQWKVPDETSHTGPSFDEQVNKLFDELSQETRTGDDSDILDHIGVSSQVSVPAQNEPTNGKIMRSPFTNERFGENTQHSKRPFEDSRKNAGGVNSATLQRIKAETLGEKRLVEATLELKMNAVRYYLNAGQPVPSSVLRDLMAACQVQLEGV